MPQLPMFAPKPMTATTSQRRLVTGVLLLAALLVAGCVTAQPEGSAESIGVEQVRRTPDAPAASVRWGGTIASVDNAADGRASLQIVSRPLASDGRPRHVDRSAGRFIARFDEVLDPLIYKVGRDITVLGQTAGVEQGSIGDAPYGFPVVTVESHRYWRPQRARTLADDPCHLYPVNHGYGTHRHDGLRCRSGFGSSFGGRHGPWLSDWPHPFGNPRGHRHPRRHRSGISIFIGGSL